MAPTPTPLHLSSGDKRISELQERTALQMTDMFTLVAGGLNWRAPIQALLDTVVGELTTELPPNAWNTYGTAGVFTWVKPTSPKYYGSFVAVFGPGGPGGGVTGTATSFVAVASGGGGGGCALGYYAAEVLRATEIMTVGPSTVGAANGSAVGVQGASSSFTTTGATLAASGGNPGASAIASGTIPPALDAGGQGGVGVGSPLGDWAHLRGASGGFSIYNSAATDGISGFGGGAPFFGGSALGRAPSVNTAHIGTDAVNPGSGGAGAAVKGSTTAVARGGNGRFGFGLIIDLYSITR